MTLAFFFSAIFLSFLLSRANAQGSSNTTLPLQPYEKEVIAHGICCTLGFLLFLPAGSLLARYLRTVIQGWLRFHWVFQLVIAGPIITAGVSMGIHAVSASPHPAADTFHKKLGLIIFSLYIAQFILGFSIFKSVGNGVVSRRLIQNYVHPFLGIAIIAFAFVQVRTGYSQQWPKVHLAGRPDITNTADIVWYIWIVLLPVSYLAGLALLPRQMKHETVANLPPYYIASTTFDSNDNRPSSHQEKWHLDRSGIRYLFAFRKGDEVSM